MPLPPPPPPRMYSNVRFGHLREEKKLVHKATNESQTKLRIKVELHLHNAALSANQYGATGGATAAT